MDKICWYAELVIMPWGYGWRDATERYERWVAFVCVAALAGSLVFSWGHGLELIFKAAHIETSIRIEGRRTRTPEATFHSLRHTFVSLAANAGVPLPVVQSIVGHSSTAMTRHYYHENEEVLRQAVAAIPAIGERGMGNGERSGMGTGSSDRINKIDRIKGERGRSASVPARLKRLDKYLAQGLITQDEHAVQRARILAEL